MPYLSVTAIMLHTLISEKNKHFNNQEFRALPLQLVIIIK